MTLSRKELIERMEAAVREAHGFSELRLPSDTIIRAVLAVLDQAGMVIVDKAILDEARALVDADNNADTKHGGLADCTDSTGGPYQSQGLANIFSRLTAALTDQQI